MEALAACGRQALAALLCLSLVVWSVMSTVTHAPAVCETIQDHLEMVEDHGHSHGFEEDLYWALHDHSHDLADHHHNQAYLSKVPRTEPVAEVSELWLRIAAFDGPKRHFRTERPPRV